MTGTDQVMAELADLRRRVEDLERERAGVKDIRVAEDCGGGFALPGETGLVLHINALKPKNS